MVIELREPGHLKHSAEYCFGELVEGHPTAVIKITLRADDEVIEAELVKSSGNAGWDNALRVAVLRARQMPRDVDGRVPQMLIISFKPHQ